MSASPWKTNTPVSNSDSGDVGSKVDKKKICIVGGGISGLSAAFLLARDGKHDVTLFDRFEVPGIDAHNATISLDDGSVYDLDIPFRVFNRKYYQNLVSLLDFVGISWIPVDYCGSYCRTSAGTDLSRPDYDVFFKYSNALVGPLSIPFVRGRSLFSADVMSIMWDYIRFNSVSPRHLLSGQLAKGMTIGEYLDTHGYSEAFKHDVLINALAVMCTCTYKTMRSFPADMVIACMAARSGYGIQRAVGGNSKIASKLSEGYRSCPGKRVTGVFRSPGNKDVIVQIEGDDTEHVFDEVVFATQANHALELLKDKSVEERKALELFEYEASDVIVHTDDKFMPGPKDTWSGVNFYTGSESGESVSLGSMPMATIWVNKVNSDLHGQSVDYFQTWNPHFEPKEGTLIARSSFERPVMSPQSVEAIAKLEKLQGKAKVWFCGSYAREAMPLLENGVTTAMNIAIALGSPPPWVPHGKPDVNCWFSNRFIAKVAVISAAVALVAKKRDVIVDTISGIFFK